ncbi:metalloregulator ArsR/SmtB family transcription factor [Rhodobacterales bacterium HKCCE3408]|nr:metalloregulator ArsR/SmtB family transcription factor [Rhodobacterales bacterium HKCCE3408]
MDLIFKALNDPARRALLDSLRQKDGQTLGELEAQLDMTRFGVMKHLGVLEEAGLIATRREGRFKYHYLNAVPLQEVVDRWIEPLIVGPTARSVLDLKHRLEGNTMAKPDFMMSTFIDCTHDALWDALTKGELIARYHFACQNVQGDMEKPGDTVDYEFDAGGTMLSNRVISIDPKTRIEMEFQPHWGDNPTTSRCVYLIDPQAAGMKLTVEHYGLGPEDGGIHDGWARFLAGLKTFAETGKSVRFFMPMQMDAPA